MKKECCRNGISFDIDNEEMSVSVIKPYFFYYGYDVVCVHHQ